MVATIKSMHSNLDNGSLVITTIEVLFLESYLDYVFIYEDTLKNGILPEIPEMRDLKLFALDLLK